MVQAKLIPQISAWNFWRLINHCVSCSSWIDFQNGRIISIRPFSFAHAFNRKLDATIFAGVFRWLIDGFVRGVIAFIHPGKFLAKFGVGGVDQVFLALK